MNQDILYRIALTKMKKVGPVTIKNLVSYSGGVTEVFKESKGSILKIPQAGAHVWNELQKKESFIEAEKEIEFIEKNDILPIFYLDDLYPSRLKHYPDGPAMLYFQGESSIFSSMRTLGVVGTRTATEMGKIACENIIEEAKSYGLSTISGLAYGIDATCHRKSQQMGIPTLGVLGHGLGMTYPPSHKSLRKKMLEMGGVVTEFGFKQMPEREHFPMRNRIIAGMSDALLVVESKLKGGSMITAHMAFSYNKDVFAVPGRVNDENSEGPNHLIKTNVAALAESMGDIAYKMLWDKTGVDKPHQLEMFVELDEKENFVVQLLEKGTDEGMHVDQLHGQTDFSTSQLAAVLLSLEFKNVIKSLPGSFYLKR